MTPLGHDDPFGSLSALPDGLVVPELTPKLWDKRDNVDLFLPWVVTLVRASGLPQWWEQNISQEKERLNPGTRRGDPRDVSVEAIIVAWFMCKSTRKSLLDTEMARFLLHTISDEQRAALGVPPVAPDPTSQRPEHERGWLDKQAVARRIGRLTRQMLDLVDPSEYRQPRDRRKIDKNLLRRDITLEQRLEAQRRLDWVVARMTTMPLAAAPRWLRRQWPGDAAVDGTHIPLASHGNTKHKNAWDSDSGVYKRVKATGTPRRPRAARARPCRRRRSA